MKKEYSKSVQAFSSNRGTNIKKRFKAQNFIEISYLSHLRANSRLKKNIVISEFREAEYREIYVFPTKYNEENINTEN